MKKEYRGFTLVELIVVIAIIGVLAAVLAPALLGFIKDSKDAKAQADAKTIHTSIHNSVKLENGGDFPKTKAYLKSALASGSGQAKLSYVGIGDSCHSGTPSNDADLAKLEILQALNVPDYSCGFVVFASQAFIEYGIDQVYVYWQNPSDAAAATADPDGSYPQ